MSCARHWKTFEVSESKEELKCREKKGKNKRPKLARSKKYEVRKSQPKSQKIVICCRDVEEKIRGARREVNLKHPEKS